VTVGQKLKRDYSPVLALFSLVPFQYEGPRHAELRRAMARALAPFAPREDLFKRRVEKILETPLRAGGMDFADEFAREVLFQIFCDLMEVPESDRPQIREISRISHVLEAFLPVRLRDSSTATVVSAAEYFRVHVKRQVEMKRPCLINAIYREMPVAESERVIMTAYMACIMLVMGNDAMSGVLTRGIRQLLGVSGHNQTPIPQERWGEISDDMVRHAAPVDFLARTVKSDTVVAGCPFSAGTNLLVSAHSANHDPERFGEKADEISPAPSSEIGLAFGAGAHICVGNRISRNIAKATMSVLARMPAIHITGQAKRTDGNVVRVISSLPVTFR
jgi:cytochrome P450